MSEYKEFYPEEGEICQKGEYAKWDRILTHEKRWEDVRLDGGIGSLCEGRAFIDGLTGKSTGREDYGLIGRFQVGSYVPD